MDFRGLGQGNHWKSMDSDGFRSTCVSFGMQLELEINGFQGFRAWI